MNCVLTPIMTPPSCFTTSLLCILHFNPVHAFLVALLSVSPFPLSAQFSGYHQFKKHSVVYVDLLPSSCFALSYIRRIYPRLTNL